MNDGTRAGAAYAAVLTAPEQAARKTADLIAESLVTDEAAVSLVDTRDGSWRVTIYFAAPPDEAAVRALAAAAAGADIAATLRFEPVAARDWVNESLAGLPPVTAGRFVVHGAHDRRRVAPNRIGIEIEAALAFGTGHHGTTRGCLLALDRLCKTLSAPRRKDHRQPGVRAKRRAKGDGRHTSRRAFGGCRRMTGLRILDLGTGTGVLAIAAARAWRRPVLAIDLDALAVRAARENARLNRVAPLLTIVQANGPFTPAVNAQPPFTIVFANILLGPLQRLAKPLQDRIAPGGILVLSGLLAAQANAARTAYHGFRLERRIDIDGWTTLVLRRARQRPAAAVAPAPRET